MNTEDLDRMLSKCNLDDCVAFFANASEADRKIVSKRALQWYELAEATRISKLPGLKFAAITSSLPKRVTKQLELAKQKDETIPAKARDSASVDVAALAVLATCGITEVRPLGIRTLPQTLAVLKSRNPRWLNKWMDFACEKHPSVAWNYVHALERDGLAQAERSSPYWLSMAYTLGQLDAESLLRLLREDRELLDVHVWQMLSCDDAIRGMIDPHSVIKEPSFTDFWDDGNNRWKTYTESLQNAVSAATIWKVCLAELAASGDLDRERLNDVLFSWIARLGGDGESKPAMNGTRPIAWFQEIMDETVTTNEQRSAVLGRYIGLLSAKDSTTLAWSLKNLAEVDPASLPLKDLLGNISNVFFVKRKEPALAAVKFLETLIKKYPDNEQLANTLCDAFEHTSSEVHKRALSLVKKYKLNERFDLSEQLSERLSGTSALLREEAKGLAPEAESGEDMPSTAPSMDIEELLRALADIPESLQSAAEIDAAIGAYEQSRLPHALSLHSFAIPRLDPAGVIEPISSLDDLVFLLAQVLEGNSSSESIERVLDGMLRCCDQRPEDFEQRVSSLRKKMTFGGDAAFSGVNSTIDIAAVVRAWIDPPRKFNPTDLLNPLFRAVGSGVSAAVSAPPAALGFFSERTRSIEQLVSKRVPLPLISAPTHKGGWIDPRVLPDRIQQWRRAGVKLDRADFIQALLRLAPEYRNEALLKLDRDKPDELVRALVWALGGPQEGVLSSAEIWVAAFRCREPRGKSRELAQKFPGLGPDTAELGSYEECLKNFKERSNSMFGVIFGYERESLALRSNPPVKVRPSLRFFPTELLHTDEIGWTGSVGLDFYWPLNRESFMALETRRMSLYLESQGSYWKSSWESLFDPDTPLNGFGCWLIALGMAAKQMEVSGLALDALISGIDDYRIDGTTFGTVMGKLFLTDKITVSRWLTGLKAVARISPLHSFFVFQTLEQLLQTANSDHEGLNKPVPPAVLELMYDCCSGAPYRVESQAARDILSRFEGKGKAAKLAKLLLEPSKSASADFFKQLAAQVLSSRIERAKRWNSRLQQVPATPAFAALS